MTDEMTGTQRLTLTIAILASFVSGLDGFIVNVALPAISGDLGGGLSTQQWTVDAYLITLGSVILIAGSLSDLFGRKRILVIGLYWFGITSGFCALAQNGVMLIIGRALQGIAGAMLVPSSLALIVSAFSGAAQSKAIGTWTGWTTISAVIGPLLGGLLVGIASWQWIFAINVVPVAVTLYMLRGLELREVTRSETKVDLPGAILCAIGLAGPVYALIEEPSRGWRHPLVWVPLIVGGLVFLAFLWVERRTRAPMLPLSMFRERNVAFGNLATIAIYAGLTIATFIVVITLQQVAHYSALVAGFVMVPVTAIMFVGSGRFGALAGRYGPRFFMTAGPLVGAAGFLLMLVTREDMNYWTQLLPGILVFGLGLSMTVAPLTSAILGSVPEETAGIASAVNNAVARVAGLVAVALTGLVTGPVLTLAGFHRALVLIAVLLVAGGVVSWFGIVNPERATPAPDRR
ncbi:MFS transporter [Labedaea rhizosphaerae]|uniref:EmrB/QacA subfamily drug resistance transporter n=1 Tax=Labedaea rhizosphaerae TaxID=598644 RepID=A0A4R6RWH0_LABRH|nr:MFS transporter [Labedaea rhizosphaerae]TDP90496.1 EmrB/QacA subfamily drug resistance transporter [Labedaea rhizosphaerae]